MLVKTYRGVNVLIYTFLISALVDVCGQLQASTSLPSRERVPRYPLDRKLSSENNLSTLRFFFEGGNMISTDDALYIFEVTEVEYRMC
jgi:hypothetical protein